MAKTKAPNNIEESIIKNFGEVIEQASFLSQRRNKIINVSPNLDVALGGGIPEGSFALIAGKHSYGKSSLALQIAANAQKIDSDFGQRDVYYFDIEGRLKDRDLKGQGKLDFSPERFKIICSKEGNILSGEDFLSIGEQLISTKRGAVFIFDSFSAICTSGRMEAKMGDRYRDDAPLLLSHFCKRISQIIPVNKSIVIGINHIIANQGMGHKLWLEASGQKVQYQADVKMIATYTKAWEINDKQVGNLVHWNIEKTALGTPPAADVETWLRFGYGYDEFKETVDLAIGCGEVMRSGSWVSISDPDEYCTLKCQGIDNFVNELSNKPEIFEKMRKNVLAKYIG